MRYVFARLSDELKINEAAAMFINENILFFLELINCVQLFSGLVLLEFIAGNHWFDIVNLDVPIKLKVSFSTDIQRLVKRYIHAPPAAARATFGPNGTRIGILPEELWVAPELLLEFDRGGA